jgi:hypothetical protein
LKFNPSNFFLPIVKKKKIDGTKHPSLCHSFGRRNPVEAKNGEQ